MHGDPYGEFDLYVDIVSAQILDFRKQKSLQAPKRLLFLLTWRHFFQSDDCTVFFFTVGDTYKPIGFIETASPVVSMGWSEKKGKVHYLCLSCRS